MRRIACLMFVSLTFLLCSGMAVETFAQNVLAVKSLSTGIVTRPNQTGGWQDTCGASCADLMNVTAFASHGSNLLICMTARQEAGALAARAFGVEILNSAGIRVSFTHLTGHIATVTPDLVGSGCFHWSPPADDDYTFKLMTFQSGGPPADLSWLAERQILVLELIPSPQNSSSMNTELLLEAVKELKAEVKGLKTETQTLKNRMAGLESRISGSMR